jgi:hypothetical protein
LLDRVGQAVESFRNEALKLDVFDPLLEEVNGREDEVEGPVDAGDLVQSDPVADLRIRVLGPVNVSGWALPPERAIVTELACYLALHSGRRLTGDELRVALWPDPDKEPSAKTLRSYLSLLRKAVGTANLPSAGGSGYGIGERVTTDWDEFRQLAGAEGLEPKLQALELVRGRPFAGVASGTYAWVFAELWVSDMEIQIGQLALQVAGLSLERGDHETAVRALRQGLLGAPSDLALWKSYLSVAGALSPGRLERAEAEARAALGLDAAELL